MCHPGKLASLPASERLLIAISGIPGSGAHFCSYPSFQYHLYKSTRDNELTLQPQGKTTLAATVVKQLNARHKEHGKTGSAEDIAAFIPMDGYHLTRQQLSALPNAEEAFARRGAEFTFDGAAFLTLVREVRKQGPDALTVYAPSFDHALKDPKANDIPIRASARVIIFEGLYLSLNQKPWNEAAALMDESWFVDVDFETARKRLVERHIRSGICNDANEADRRARENDLVNGKQIVSNRILAIDELVRSKEDSHWQPESQGV